MNIDKILDNKFLKIIECGHTDKLLGYYYSSSYSPNNWFAHNIKPITGEYEYEYIADENCMVRVLDFESLDSWEQETYFEEISSGNLVRLVNSGSYLVPLYLINFWES